MTKPVSLESIVTTRLPAIDEFERQIVGCYVLLWSQSQNSFHIEQLRHTLSSNRRAYAEDRRMDYVPVFFGLQDDCCQLADALRGTLHSREQLRNHPSSLACKGDGDAR